MDMTQRSTDVNAKLDAKFDAIVQNLEPRGFLQLAITAKAFIAVAGLLMDIYDEADFQRAFSRFVLLMLRFHATFQQAFDMNLLIEVDETTLSAPRDLRALDRALATSHRRVECIAIVCRSAEAAACLIGVRRFPNLVLAWGQMFELVLDRPIFAPIFRDIDLAKWSHITEESDRMRAALAKQSGFRRIDIRGPCYTLSSDAGALWVDSLVHEVDKDKLLTAARLMKRLLSFLTLPPQERWVLQEFHSIGSTDSIEAVLKEVLRYDIRPLQRRDLHQELRQGLVEHGILLEDEPLASLVLTEGWLRKREYFVSLPGVQYFVDRFSQTAFESTGNTVSFLRTHCTGVRRSLEVEHRQRQLLTIENAITDVRFKETMQHLGAHVAGEAFAVAVSSSLGASPEASIFIASCFGAVVEVMMKLKED